MVFEYTDSQVLGRHRANPFYSTWRDIFNIFIKLKYKLKNIKICLKSNKIFFLYKIK